jgi:UDP-N-acetylmuramoylalanine--D-glutamate ligase
VKPRPALPGGPYLVVGLARSGVAAAMALRARGEEVIGCDAGAPDEPRLAEAVERLSRSGVEVHLDASGDDLAARARTLIKSPGVPREAPAVQAALARGMPVLGELELAWRLLPNEFVAVTGTNGKTTTTEWIGHIHREAELEVAVAGNVGTAAASLINAIEPSATVICECSSFQLEDAEAFAPEVGVLLNLSPDHLDRHGSFEAYTAAKMRVFNGNEISVIPPDGFSLTTSSSVIRYGTGPEAELAENIALPGEHNRRNGMAAAAVCLARGIDPDAVAQGLRSFTGVAHRLELVAVHDGVSFVNDSKATNVASTLVALDAYPGGIHLIAGGRGKQQDFAALAAPVAERCEAVYLIGEAADELEPALASTGVPLRRCGDLERAVAAASASATTGQVVLLSPACASYDQYEDFEARGRHFRALTEGL